MSKKILHIITGLGDGGAEAALFRLLVHSMSVDDDTHLVISLSDDDKYVTPLREIGVEVFVLNLKNKSGRLVKFGKLIYKIQRLKPDVVQTWMYHANLIGGYCASLCGIKNIIWGIHNGELGRETDKFSTRLVNRLSRYFSYKIPRKIAYCGQSAKKIHENYGYDTSKSAVIPNGIDAKNFSFARCNDLSEEGTRKNTSQTFVIGHLGRYHPVKNYKLMLDVFEEFLKHSHHKQVELHLYGTGLSNKNMELCRAISDRGIEAKVTLFGPTLDVQAAYRTFDVFLLTSMSEAFPTVLNEAMLCGVPCISTDVGDACAIVECNGWVISSHDPKGLGDAIAEACQEKETFPHLWERRRNQCREHISRNFDIGKMLDDYRAIWCL